MKKVNLLLLTLFACFSYAFGQTYITEKPGGQTLFQTNSLRDNWFFGLGTSATWYSTVGLFENQFFKRPSWNANAQFGKWITPTWGFRVSAFAGSMHSFNPDQTVMAHQKMWNAQLDAMFDVSNYFMRYTPDRLYHFIVYVGAGGGQAMDPVVHGKPGWGGTRHHFTTHAGFINKFQLSQQVAIDLEFSATSLPYDLNRLSSPNIDNAKYRYNSLLSLGANLVYTFGNTSHAATGDFYESEFGYVGRTTGFAPACPCSATPTEVEKVVQQIEKLAEIQPQIALITPVKVVKTLSKKGQAYLDFPVNQTVINPNFRRNPEELGKINKVFDEIKRNEDAVISNILIEGFASPDGPYANNVKLSEGRAQALKTYIQKRNNLNNNLFSVTSVPEDWDGLVDLIKASPYVPAKDQVLVIIENTGIFDGRESKLVKLDGGRSWNYMKTEFFPQLRRVEYQVGYTIRDFSLEESIQMYTTNPYNLSQQELYNVALHFGVGSPQYNDIIMNIIPKVYPQDNLANNNSGAIMILNNNLSGAQERLANAGTSPEALNNLGVLKMAQGDLEAAERYFLQAQALGNIQAESNLKAVAVKKHNAEIKNTNLENF